MVQYTIEVVAAAGSSEQYREGRYSMRGYGMVLASVASLAFFGASTARAVDSPELSSDRIEEIIQKFAARESEFAKAREAYTYRQTARIQTLDDGGKWETDSDIVFDSEGKRTEHVVFSPVSTLQLVTLTPEDMEDLR